MTPQEFDEIVAWNEIEPIGVTSFHRLLVFIGTCLANQFRDEKAEPVTMKRLAEFAGISKDQFKAESEEGMTSPEIASTMFRR